MARVWSCGFELNNAVGLEWDAILAAGPVVQSTTVRSGAYAMQVTSLGSGTAKGLRFQYLAAEATSARYFRFYIRVGTRPSAENRILAFSSCPESGWRLAMGNGRARP